jgi:uncharacterized protein YbjT (DUF2867 family)
MRVAVIGSTGNNAASWTRTLRAAGFEVTQLVRAPVPNPPPRVRQERLDLGEPGTFEPALSGVDVLGLAIPSVPGQVERELGLIDAAETAGVSRIIKLSVTGADLPSPISQFARWHAAVEARLQDSRVASVILRPNFFMQNLIRQQDSIAAGKYLEYAGGRPIAWIDVADIARVVAVVADGSYDNRTLELTGPDALDAEDLARVLHAATGRTIEVVSLTPSQLKAAMVAKGAPQWLADVQHELYEAIHADRAPHVSVVTGDIEAVTGTRPRTLAEFASDIFGQLHG